MVHVAVFVPLLALSAAPEATVAASTANSAAAASVQTDEAADLVVTPVQEAGGEEMGFIDKYFPFMPDPITDQAPLEPELQENFWILYIVFALTSPIAGIAWAPGIFVDADLGEEHFMEALISWLVHLPLFVIAWIPILGWISVLANVWYLVPLAGIQIMDRNLKATRGKPPAKWGALRQLPGMPAVASNEPAAAMAF